MTLCVCVCNAGSCSDLSQRPKLATEEEHSKRGECLLTNNE